MPTKLYLTMKFSIVLLLTAMSGVALSQTSIPAGSVSGTWSADGSPYEILGNILIPEDSTLVLEPGVTVNFQGAYKLLVMGQILAEGTDSNMITFTADDIINGWRGIRFDNTPATSDTSKFTYCILERGNAAGVNPEDNGGVLYFRKFSNAVISNCLLSNNKCDWNGGAIYCSDSDPIIQNNTISGNESSNYGGGMYCTISLTTIQSNLISNNQALSGGGIYCEGGGIKVSFNTITSNTATLNGGGVAYRFSPSSIFSNNVVSQNSSASGGGIYCYNSSDPSIINSLIANNSASFKGGGLYCEGGSSPYIVNSIITNNTADVGGGCYCHWGLPVLINSNVTNNLAANGGGFYCELDSDPTLLNVVLHGNTSNTAGDQVYLFDESSDPDISYSDVDGGSGNFFTNGNFFTGTYLNNIDSSVQFVAPSGGAGDSFNGVSADWSLQSASPCIDRGDSIGSGVATDLAGNPRIQGCIIDIGAYEYQGSVGLSVATSSTPSTEISPNCNGIASAIVSGGIPPYTYSWSNGQTTSSANALCAGLYQISIIDANNCTYTDEIEVFLLTGQNVLINTAVMNLYPNPTTNESILMSSDRDAALFVHDMMGVSLPTAIISKREHYVIDLSDKPVGVYFVVVHSNEQIRRYRLVKQ